MTPRLLYLVPPDVSRSSTVNLQSLIDGLLSENADGDSANVIPIGGSGRPFRVEVAVLGKRHAQLLDWLAKRQVPAYGIPVRGSMDVGLVLRVRRFLLQQNPELVHVWQGSEYLGIWGSALSGAKRVLVDQTIPDCALPGRPVTAPSSVFSLLKRRLADQSQAFVERFDSAELTAASGDACSAAEKTDHWHIIPPGVRVPAKRTAVVDQAAAPVRASLGLPHDAQLIGASSAFRRGGGGKDIVWAADLLKCVRDNTHVLLFGDGPLRWRLERFRWQTETEDRVHFVDEERFDKLLPHLFCFWLPVHTAGEVQSLLSAMAMGVPVVASDLPSHRQIVKDLETGMLVTPGNRGSLARKTDLLLRDDDLRRRLGEAGREHAKQYFTIDQQVNSYSRLYAEILTSV